MSDLGNDKKELILDAMGEGVVTAATLGKATGCSVRTVYRYVVMARAEGHKILSGPGYGFMLKRRATGQEIARNG